jgi:N-acetyl-gamma-glutamyl-phosphate reductase
MNKIKAGIIGGTGYTGVELLRLLHNHPKAEVIAISSRSEVGQRADRMFPSLVGHCDLVFSLLDAAILDECDVIFIVLRMFQFIPLLILSLII